MATSIIQKSLNSEVNSLEGRFVDMSSGSMHDITESGIYFLRGAATDKPVPAGGLLVIAKAVNGWMCGLYTTIGAQKTVHNVVRDDQGNWTSSQL
jgi:hypothetical protein